MFALNKQIPEIIAQKNFFKIKNMNLNNGDESLEVISLKKFWKWQIVK